MAVGVMMAASAMPQSPLLAQARPAIIVKNDPGGLLGQRSREIGQLRISGTRVELRGACNSACTMYLGLENVCVARDARFGFHGPSWYGEALPPDEFDHWSGVMARNYREPLRNWFMETARYRITGHIVLSGAELIRMGYAEC